MSEETTVRRVIRDLRGQIGAAKRAGVSEDDLCIAFPSGYLAFISGFPTIEIDGKTIAMVTLGWTESFFETAAAEAGLPSPL